MLPRLLILSVLVHVIVCLPQVQKARYDGHKVLEILHNTEADFKKLLELEVQLELDFWKLPRHQNDTTLINVAPHYMDQFLQYMKHYDMKVSSFIDDVQKFVEDGPTKHPTHNSFKRAQSTTRSSSMNLYVYHTHASIRNYLNYLAQSSIPNRVVSVFPIGQSFEGRQIEVIKIQSTQSNNGAPKKSILIDGGIHAREWIAPATVIYFIENLLYNPSNDPTIEAVLSAYDIELIPVLNPDGYEYTDYVRLWRKNRSTSSSSCVGVDLNRNFPFQWNPDVGGSVNTCSDLYSGPGADSEPETQALTGYIGFHTEHPSYIAYLTIHSYGQMWLYPWGYTSALPADWSDLDNAAGVAIETLRSVHHTKYVKGSSTNVLYSAAGGSDDFAKGGGGVKYSYTLELRDTGRYGFSLPASEIQPVGEETLEGFLAFALRVKEIENF